MNNIGAASGKLARYLKCGLPVIVNNFEGTRRLIEEFDGGAWVDDVQGVEDAIHSILQEYDRKRANAFRAFREGYEFSKHLTATCDLTDALSL